MFLIRQTNSMHLLESVIYKTISPQRSKIQNCFTFVLSNVRITVGGGRKGRQGKAKQRGRQKSLASDSG